MRKVKNRTIPIYILWFAFCIFCFYCGIPLSAQEKVNLSVGMGIPELINGSVRFQLKQAQVGFSFGVMPVKDESVIAVGGTGFIHLGGHSRFSERLPWYGRFGLDYLRDEKNSNIDKFLYLNLRVGRDLNISKKIGISLDLGVDIQLSHERIGTTSWLDIEIPVLPGFGIGLFYRL